MFAGLVIVLLSVAMFLTRKPVSGLQTQALLVIFHVGEGREAELSAGLAQAWTAFAVLVCLSGLIILLTSVLIT